ncbi:Hypothetical_protein [Hexamita inflata]|uniref:Hypothetical_protein n=1 Tax=Hexamita inflata TaxID=28002 RepID=A0AA86NCU8_9EUKA|nr:Hypothetical protein HINF_LOCUS4431 [Hexamita inflata]
MLQSPSQNGKQREYRFQHFQKNSRNLKPQFCTTFTFRRGPNARAESTLWKAAEDIRTATPRRLLAFAALPQLERHEPERRPIRWRPSTARPTNRNRWRRGHQQITLRAAFARSRLEGEMWIFAVYLRWPNAKTGVANGGARTGRMRGQSLPGHTPRQKTRPANRSAANQIFTGAPSLKITVGRPLLAKATRSGLDKQTATQSRASSPETIMVLSQSEVFEMESWNPNRLRDQDSLASCAGHCAIDCCARRLQLSEPCSCARSRMLYSERSDVSGQESSQQFTAGGRVTGPFGRSAPRSQVGAALKHKYSMQLPRFRSQASTPDNSCACLGESGTYMTHLSPHLKLL